MENEIEAKRLGIKKHTLNLNKKQQSLPAFLWSEYKDKTFLIRSWPKHHSIPHSRTQQLLHRAPYEHWYIEGPEDGGRCIRFEFLPYSINSKEENNQYMVTDMFLYSFLPHDSDHKTFTDFKMTEDIWKRMNIVCSATNFSFCLRNSEHLVNFIVFEKWNCNQMQMEESLREHFAILNGENKKLIAMLPNELKIMEEQNMKEAQKPMFSDMEASIRFEKKLSVEQFKSSDDVQKKAFNIIFAGPTGAGKSTLINLAFNETICKTAVDTSSSVTREVTILSGKYKCKDERDIRVNIFDTMGVCDTYLNDDEVINDMMKAIDIAKSRVVVVCSGVIKTEQTDAIGSFLQKLNYKNNKENFIFLYNKSEGMEIDEKEDGLVDMGEALEVDLNYQITYSVPEGKGTTCIAAKYYAGHYTGFNTDQNDDDCKATVKVLRDCILPQAGNEWRKARIEIDVEE